MIFRYPIVKLLLTRYVDREFAMFLGFVLAIIMHVVAWRRASVVIRAENAARSEKVQECLRAMIGSSKS